MGRESESKWAEASECQLSDTWERETEGRKTVEEESQAAGQAKKISTRLTGSPWATIPCWRTLVSLKNGPTLVPPTSHGLIRSSQDGGGGRMATESTGAAGGGFPPTVLPQWVLLKKTWLEHIYGHHTLHSFWRNYINNDMLLR